MKIEQLGLKDAHLADDLAVVIDVIRAFTTQAFAFANGVEKIFLVGTVQEAFALHKLHPDALLMGEVQGQKIEGFHFGNSPLELYQDVLLPKTMIQRTSSGTQGVCLAVNAKNMLTASFVVADATVAAIQAISPKKLSFIITGTIDGGREDVALANYIEAKLLGKKIDPSSYLDQVRNSATGKAFSSGLYPFFTKDDLDAVCQINRFDFAMQVNTENGIKVAGLL